MDPDPDRRQHTAGAFVRELDAALGDRVVPGRPGTFAPTEPMTPPVAHEPDSSAQVGPRPFVFEPRRRRRWLRPAIVAGACLLLAGGVWLALSTGGGEGPNGNGSGQQAAAQKQAGGRSTASSEGGSTAAAETTPRVADAPAVASAATGAQLNEEGYSLIQEARYAEAIPVLRRAVASFPKGTTDINYAYALYNLGHALRMNGQAEEAVPVLEQRLQIPDQTQTVRTELEAARAEANR
jgi:tetratricopeptide (TPR) repeat protein